MKFKTPSGIDFEIPDDWWNFAEMNDFSACRTTYTHGRQESRVGQIGQYKGVYEGLFDCLFCKRSISAVAGR